jgi:hypothetical protein
MQMHIEIMMMLMLRRARGMLVLKMLASAPTILLTPVLALPALIYANQIPVHYGIIVDVAFPDAINATSVKTLEHVFTVGSCQTPIPGQLCAVENSGHGSPRHD